MPVRHQKVETPRSMRAFTEYCLLGPGRSLEQARERFATLSDYKPISRKTIAHWSASFNWVERSRQYDMDAAEAERKAILESDAKERGKRREQRLKDAEMVRAVARDALINATDRRELRKLGKEISEGTLSPRALEVLVNALSKMAAEERLDLGEATERTHISSDAVQVVIREYSGFDPDQV